ncbi:MAG: thiopeptide-type bacteriocin biosynthesis protein [Pseudonocardiaceae bacterium]
MPAYSLADHPSPTRYDSLRADTATGISMNTSASPQTGNANNLVQPIDDAPAQVEKSILAVLVGVPLHQAAAISGITPADLVDAVTVYRAAGQGALRAHAARDWYQVLIQFTDWDAAERIGAHHLGPLLQAQDAATVTDWWFLRKHPCWRLRCRPGSGVRMAGLETAVTAVLDDLSSAGLIDRWRQSIYEPETLAFGGSQATDIAHNLFHADSRGVLDFVRRHDPAAEVSVGRRELSVLLCCTLLRSAGQEWHEQGDVWHRVAQLRPLPPGTPTERLEDLTRALRRLMTLDTAPTGTLFGTGGPLAFAAPWTVAFGEAGRALGNLAGNGALVRGLRDVLAHHVIFHWNRLGLADRTQAILAQATRHTIMNPPDSLLDTRPAHGR